MSFEIKSPCRSCENIYGTKDVCRAYCQELQSFRGGLLEYTKYNVDCYARDSDMGGVPLSVEDNVYQRVDKDTSTVIEMSD